MGCDMKTRLIISTILFSALLSACVSRGLVASYDAEVEKSTNAYHKSVASFVATAVEKKQKYEDPKVQKFYSEQGALLRNLLINSQVKSANRPCPARLLTKSRALVPAKLQNDIVQSESTGASEKFSCTYIVLNHLYNSHLSLQEIHKLNGRLTPIVADLSLSQVEDAVRIVLRNEQAKKGG